MMVFGDDDGGCKGKRIMGHYESFFGEVVEIFRAQVDDIVCLFPIHTYILIFLHSMMLCMAHDAV
jgi:hypothetical protein